MPYDRAKYRELRTLSGGEQKRLVLEYLLRGPDEVLLLDEPDNFLDVPGKIWLEQRIRESEKTILFISHDRELLDNTATRVVTVELGSAGNLVWTHPGGFASYHEARRDRFARFEELRRRWDEEHAKIKALVLHVQDQGGVQRRHGQPVQGRPDPAAQVRGGRPADRAAARAAGEDAAQGRPHRQARGRLRGPRAHRADAALRPRGLVRRAGRRARLNGSGKSHFLRLLAAGGSDPDVEHQPGRRRPDRAGRPHRQGQARRPGAAGLVRADPRAPRAGRPHPAGDPAPRRRSTATGWAASRPAGCWTATSSPTPASRSSSRSAAASRPGSRSCCWSSPARRCCCSTSRPTTSTSSRAEALEDGLEAFEGTVLAVTHDRWFARGFDRFLVYGADGSVYESDGPVWDEGRVQRVR